MIVIAVGFLAALGSAWLIGRSWMSRGALAGVFLAALGAYSVLGQPGMKGQALGDRIETLRQSDPVAMSNDQRLVLLQQYAIERPDDPEPHRFIGDIMRASGRYDEAIRAYQSALRRNDAHAASLRGMADALVAQAGGRVDDMAANIYRALLVVDPEDVQAAFMVGMQQWLGGNPDAARDWWSQAEAAMPEGSPARAELAALANQVQSAMAAAAARRAAEAVDAEDTGNQ